MKICSACDGLIPPRSLRCPNCQVTSPKVSRAVSLLSTLLGSSALAVTLMACYGLPPCDSDDDADHDGAYASACDPGFDTPYDCDDDNILIHECANDPEGDGIDQNCDGVDGEAPKTMTSSTSTVPVYDVCDRN
jgi:hypothetical protein